MPITENGVKYMVDVKDGQKTGFFLDQKENRKAVGRLSRGFEVLDCFTHTGSFALNAALGGAAHVTGVDASELAVNQARENAVLNGVDSFVDFVCADVLNIFRLWKKKEKNLIWLFSILRPLQNPEIRLKMRLKATGKLISGD